MEPNQLQRLDRVRTMLDQSRGTLDARQNDLVMRQDQANDQRDAALDPMEKNLQTEMGKPLPERPTTPGLPKPPGDLPVTSEDYQGLSTALMAIAMIGGSKSKDRWLGAANAMNGAVDGFIKGHKAQADQAWKKYEAEFQSAREEERRANDEFKSLLQNRSLSINELISQYKVIAQKYDRQDARLAAEQRSLDGMWKSVESHELALDKLYEQHEKAVTARGQRRSAEQADEIALWKALYPNAALGLPDKKKGDLTFEEFQSIRQKPESRKLIEQADEAMKTDPQNSDFHKRVRDSLRERLKEMGVNISGATEDPVDETILGKGMVRGAADTIQLRKQWERETIDEKTDLNFDQWLKENGYSNAPNPKNRG